AALPAEAQLRSVAVAGRLSFDVGSVFVSDTDRGIGGGLGLRLAFGDERAVWEVGGELDVAGYVGEGDGDPIVTAAVLVSYRGFSDGEGVRAYWTAGVGVGALGIAGGGLVIPFKAGAGVSVGHDGPAGLQIGVFDRFNLITTGGDPSREFINNLGVEVALRLGNWW
ncbi:MAG TPA: hypothetical protein VFO85_19850, partial [Vicinamibacteria bacterium]|nr:hypothetical protein [Vicinamibacteria bacterium]